MSNNDDDFEKKAAEARLGQVLDGKYRLDRLIGIGGMAAVYAATHRNSSRVAIKLLHPMISANADIRARFLREGYVANTVGHPGAVSVSDDDVTEDGAVFLVMELLDGSAIDKVWEKSGMRLDPRVVLSIAYGLLDVLAAAHEKGIVHRDVKPDNVFVTKAGVVKLLDFGIARLRDASNSTATRTGTTMGTPAFMAPEQAMGKSAAVDGLTDVFAAGAVMFSLLSGYYVQEGETANELMVYAATRPARSLATVVPDMPAPIVQLVDKALAFDKAQRWQSAAQMRDAIAQVCLALYGGSPLTGSALAQTVFASFDGPLTVPHAPGFASPAVAMTPATVPMMATPAGSRNPNSAPLPTFDSAGQTQAVQVREVTQLASMSKITPSPQMVNPPVPASPTRGRKRSNTALLAGAGASLLVAAGIAAAIMIAKTNNGAGVSNPQAVSSPALLVAPVAPSIAEPQVTATAPAAATATPSATAAPASTTILEDPHTPPIASAPAARPAIPTKAAKPSSAVPDKPAPKPKTPFVRD